MPDSEPVSVLLASQIITMDSGRPNARAVAVRGSRIVTVGSLEEVTSALRDEPFSIDRTHEHDVILPGLIDQHLHPFLGATTLTTEVIATEDWHLPSRTFPAANSESEYRARLAAADAAIEDPDEWLFSWGYHSLWHGPLDRSVLDSISATRPIGIWQRSCHEFYMNTAAIDALGWNWPRARRSSGPRMRSSATWSATGWPGDFPPRATSTPRCSGSSTGTG